MNIAVIGGGWIGCHLSSKLLEVGNTVKLFEKNNKLFNETSFNNQNRLHLGFHYPRNKKTRDLCLNTFDRFIDTYGTFTKKVDKNYYCVPFESVIDYQTYLKIFDDYKFEEVNNPIFGIEGSINTTERYIDFSGLHDYFNKKLKNITEFNASILDVKELNNYDLILNCTNNNLLPIDSGIKENALVLIYKKINTTDFDSITLVDGNFFSIYPYKENLYTVTDVQYTPLPIGYSKQDVERNKKAIEERIKTLYPAFVKDFEYFDCFISTKTKLISSSANRYPVVVSTNNIVSCYTGKIQGIFPIEDTILELIRKQYQYVK